MKLYKSYMFRGKDPAIDKLRTVIQDTGRKINRKTFREVESNGGPTVSCLSGWFTGATHRPQNATLEAAGRALGFERIWVKRKD